MLKATYSASPTTCFFIASIFVLIGVWSYQRAAQINSNLRLTQPIVTTAYFKDAYCGYESGKGGGPVMRIQYEYSYPGSKDDRQLSLATESVRFESRKSCDQELPNASKYKSQKQIWYDGDKPQRSRFTLEESSPWKIFFFMMLLAVMVALFGFMNRKKNKTFSDT
jgi:hypothetical protein